MKFFPVNENVDLQIEEILKKIRHLKDGETAGLMKKSGACYRVNYGVSVVHLKAMVQMLEPDNELARRLWYRGIRETMIMATMVADAGTMENGELEEWGEILNTIELSEQMGRNLLVSTNISEDFLVSWLEKDNMFQRYASAMSIGWRLRMHGEAGFRKFPGIISDLRNLTTDQRMHRAVAFALKMGGRFCADYRPVVYKAIDDWSDKGEMWERKVAEDVRYELDAFTS
jgi:3-methyladenine DNA glycosylase AlkD